MTSTPRSIALPLVLALLLCIAASPATSASAAATPALRPGEPAGPFARKVLEGARREVSNHTRYGAMDYRRIDYPGGDVPRNVGVCTDLVVRAFRNAGVDLQKRLYEDRLRFRSRYPKHNWVKGKADSNIDHRRCSNLAPWFAAYAERLPKTFEGDDLDEWRGGDVVFFVNEGDVHPWHVAVVSDRRTEDGMPYIIHLFPDFAAEAPVGPYLPIHSHFRWKEKAGGERDEIRTASANGVPVKRPTSPPKIRRDVDLHEWARNHRNF